MATNTLPRPQAGSWLDEMIDVRRINAEVVAYIVVIALSVVAHLWGLGVMAMHHDESVHAYPTWSLYQGRGGFTCYNGESSPVYCYDPVYHGPSLYFLMLSSYFLFGAGEFQARLPMALAGIGLVASCMMLRPYLGRGGALLAAVLLGFAPSLLYYTRFARHDGLMILWELWMVIGFLRYLDSGRRGWLYLLAAAVGLAIGTHELYYILFFIFGMFAIIRAIDESHWSNRLTLGLLVALGLCFVLMLVNPPLPVGKGLYLGDKAMLIATALGMGLLVRRVWDPTPVLLPRLRSLWQDDRRTLWTALALLGVVYVLQYSSFFAYPRGIIDGLYAGLAYWLGSQHEYARGDQPWYYYLMLLPIYEPLALFGSLTTGVILLARRLVFGKNARAEVASNTVSPITPTRPALATEVAAEGELADENLLDDEDEPNALVRAKRKLATGEGRVAVPPPLSEPQQVAVAAPFVAQRPVPLNPVPLVAALLVFWFANALMDFSWAGEKMPWLVVHMSLPGNLLVAWALARLGAWGLGREEGEDPEAEGRQRVAVTLIPGLAVLLVILLGVALWRLGDINPDQAGQRNLLGGLVQLLLAGATLYGLLTLGTRYGYRTLVALATLTIAGITGAYMLRATWLVVYDHPDTPIEPLVYVQTTPGIPLLVEDIRELAINQTRTQRSTDDITGGLSMPIIIDSGDPKADGEGSLAWPLQWYFRDFTRINWRTTETFRDAPGPNSFDVTDAQGQTGPAPVVLLYKPHVTQQVREALEQSYVQRYQNAKLNWWFPEGDKCSPDRPGYKRFYFNSWTDPSVLQGPGPKGCGPTADPAAFPPPWTPLLHPFQRENWGMVTKYLMFRTIPDDLNLGAREMEVWVRKDLVPASESVAVGGGATGGSGLLRLVAEQQIGAPGSGEGELALPTGIAVGPNGTIYIADTLNHRIQVFNADGSFLRSIGSRGSGEGQFIEPRGLAVDTDGTLYVADTWNARIVKLSPAGQVLATWGSGAQELGEGKRATITEGTAEGNAANPLGFFGPRGLALDGKGNLYIADTGNKRIVVTSTEGEFRFQWGVGGADRGSFNEPTAVAIDKAGLVYVADTWNGRVQVFQPGPDGQIDPVPAFSWAVRGWQPNTYDDPSLTVGPDGQVYVSVPASQSVLLANERGEVALRWGGPGSDLASLNGPSGMAVAPDGSLYVVDRADGRVLRFQLPSIRLEAGE